MPSSNSANESLQSAVIPSGGVLQINYGESLMMLRGGGCLGRKNWEILTGPVATVTRVSTSPLASQLPTQSKIWTNREVKKEKLQLIRKWFDLHLFKNVFRSICCCLFLFDYLQKRFNLLKHNVLWELSAPPMTVFTPPPPPPQSALLPSLSSKQGSKNPSLPAIFTLTSLQSLILYSFFSSHLDRWGNRPSVGSLLKPVIRQLLGLQSSSEGATHNRGCCCLFARGCID